MKLKKDWSLAYFLYYIFKITFWLYLVTICLEILNTSTSGSVFSLQPIPVQVEIDELKGVNDIRTENISVNIYDAMRGSMSIDARISDYPGAFFYYFGIGFFNWLVLLIGLYFGGELFKKVAEGDPFSAQNPRYLFIIGWSFIIPSAIYVALAYLPIPLIEGLDLPPGIEVKRILYNQDWHLISGIVSIVFGYVFKEGARIYEEQKLTV